MLGKAATLAFVHRRIVGPRPTAKLGTLVIVEGLLQLLARVHDKGAVLRHRLGNWPALQEQ